MTDPLVKVGKSNRERAEEIVKGDWTKSSCGNQECHCPTSEEWQELENRITKALEQAVAEAVRDKVIELCEGEDCFVAKKEQEAYAKGIAEEMAKFADTEADGHVFCGKCGNEKCD